METFPANLGKEELGSPTAPTPPLLQPAGGPKLKIIPPPPDFPSRGSASSSLRGRQLVLPLALGPRCGDTKIQAREKMRLLGGGASSVCRHHLPPLK